MTSTTLKLPLQTSILVTAILVTAAWTPLHAEDRQQTGDQIADLQQQAKTDGKAAFGHWGVEPDNYFQWTTHSNRLIPVYTFGTANAEGAANLNHYVGRNSPYRSEASVKRIYGRLPERTVQKRATWMDQTNIADLQRAAAAAGKKYIFLVVFDGMDWNTTQAAAIHNQQAVTYNAGKGSGTHFQTYNADGTAQFGFMVTSPHNNGTDVDVDTQTVKNPGGTSFGGYDPAAGGATPWAQPADLSYLIAKPSEGNVQHAYTDSSSSATSMTAGIKTYNNAVTVDHAGQPVSTVAHELQEDGWAVGVVSSVPISHATPACAYAHNVARADYQDISRDLLGLPSIAHQKQPLPGMDVVVGGGFGKRAKDGESQGKNFEPGNVYFADGDLKKADINHGGQYVTAVRTKGKNGSRVLREAAEAATEHQQRLLGFFGVGAYNGHLPFQTANGDYNPVDGVAKKRQEYSAEDLNENPTLAEMTSAALAVLQSRKKNFWLMMESGDVDWANHDNNLDCSIGAVNSGDAAVKVISNWVEQHSNWNDSLLIVTADHGHLFNLTAPEMLIAPAHARPDDAREAKVSRK